VKVEIAFEIPDAVVRAAPVVAIIVLLTAWLFILVRRRRKRERAERLMFAIRRDFIPRANAPPPRRSAVRSTIRTRSTSACGSKSNGNATAASA